jgi:citrate synthase
MMFGFPTEPYDIDPDIERTLDVLFILHADHEQNCSTSTVRIVGSSQANLFASISAGICALWGPLHGGANQEVLEMLERIHQDGGDVKKFVRGQGQELRLQAHGLRPPRLQELRPARPHHQGHADKVLSRSASTIRCSTSPALEEAALKRPVLRRAQALPERGLLLGIIYRALGFPTNMFTVLFALGRLPGWIAQWKEMNEQGRASAAPARSTRAARRTPPRAATSR